MSTVNKKIPGGRRFFKRGSLLTVKPEAVLRQATKAPLTLTHRPGMGGPNMPMFFLFPEPDFTTSFGGFSGPFVPAGVPKLLPGDTFLVLSGKPRWLAPGRVSLRDNYDGFFFTDPDNTRYDNFFWYAVKVLAQDKVGWLVLLNDMSPKCWFEKPTT